MKTKLTILITAFVISGSQLYAQQNEGTKSGQTVHQADRDKQTRIAYYKKELSISTDKAEQVLQIMDDYKQNVKEVEIAMNTTEENKRAKIDKLIEEKNNKLGKILTPQQLSKMIPTSEKRN